MRSSSPRCQGGFSDNSARQTRTTTGKRRAAERRQSLAGDASPWKDGYGPQAPEGRRRCRSQSPHLGSGARSGFAARALACSAMSPLRGFRSLFDFSRGLRPWLNSVAAPRLCSYRRCCRIARDYRSSVMSNPKLNGRAMITPLPSASSAAARPRRRAPRRRRVRSAN